MEYVLAASLIVNIVLALVVVRLLSRRRGKPLPRRKPDFSLVEKELRQILAEPEIAELVELKEFKAKTWICEATLQHKVKSIGPHWDKIVQIVKRVREQCQIPGRSAGWQQDPMDPQKMIGTTLQFGYSPEVGYRHPNEFYEELKREKKTDRDRDAHH